MNRAARRRLEKLAARIERVHASDAWHFDGEGLLVVTRRGERLYYAGV